MNQKETQGYPESPFQTVDKLIRSRFCKRSIDCDEPSFE